MHMHIPHMSDLKKDNIGACLYFIVLVILITTKLSFLGTHLQSTILGSSNNIFSKYLYCLETRELNFLQINKQFVIFQLHNQTTEICRISLLTTYDCVLAHWDSSLQQRTPSFKNNPHEPTAGKSVDSMPQAHIFGYTLDLKCPCKQFATLVVTTGPRYNLIYCVTFCKWGNPYIPPSW